MAAPPSPSTRTVVSSSRSEAFRKTWRSTPLHTYGTDEDNWLGAWAVDPLTNAWELGSDPLAFARDRARLVSTVIPELDRRLIDEGDRYAPLRAAMISMINERVTSLLPATKMIGGAHVARDHKGDPGARPPFTPVPAAEQRAALQFIMDQVFSSDAFALNAETLNKLAPNRYAHWGASVGVPLDFPLLDYADAVHSIFIDQLMHPARFQRLLNAEWRATTDSTFGVGHMLATMTAGVWSELAEGTAPNAFRRNLQRRYTDRLIRLMLASPPWRIASASGSATVPVPEHARSVSRLELIELHDRIESALQTGEHGRDTRAHLIETQARIRKALDATVTTSAD
ncbi:MAG: zinc-dependent metalloprotease [Rhodothermales bacterium]